MPRSSKSDAQLSAAPAAAGASAKTPAAYVEHPQPAKTTRRTGLSVSRGYTPEGQTAAQTLDAVEWARRPAKISGADGEVVFKMDDAEVPAGWSQLATDVAVSKYFRKAGVPTGSGAEESVRQLVRRVAHTLRTAGEK